MKKMNKILVISLLILGLGSMNVCFAADTTTAVNTDVQNAMHKTHKHMKDGMKQGMKNGMQNGMKNGMQNGMKNGMQQGMKNGMKNGKKHGMKNGLKKNLED